jgi:thiocyanate hydrolase subunit beta
MPSSRDSMSALDLVGQLHPALHRVQDWATPDEIDHARFRAYMKTSHDVGGEPDAPGAFFLKEEEQWELNTYATCEVLGWRGIWVSEERRRIDNVDVGRTMYLGLPYYGRWIWSAARVLVAKHHVTLGELIERIDEVRRRHAGGIGAELPDAAPRAEGDPAAVERNEHHRAAVGTGDPQCYAGTAGRARFGAGDPVRVRDLPTMFYTRTQEYIRGVRGTVVKASYESLAPEDEAFDRHEQPPEWFYLVRFRMADLWQPYAGCADDTLQTELPEHWLEAVEED